MVFTVMISMALIGIAIFLNQVMNDSFSFMKLHFAEPFYGRVALFTNATPAVLDGFCPTYIEDLKAEYGIIQLFTVFVMINSLGMFT